MPLNTSPPPVAATLQVEERGEYLRQAAQHFLGFWADRDAYKLLPVDVLTFVESRDFLDHRRVLYPAVMEELRELNSGKYVEAVLTGAIGTGKSTIALFTTAYQLYLLSCLKDPHRLFGLDPSSEIVFAFQSLNKLLAKSDVSSWVRHGVPINQGLVRQIRAIEVKDNRSEEMRRLPGGRQLVEAV